MMNFVPHAYPEGVQSDRHRRAAPAVGQATVPLRTGVHPHMQHFHVQQQLKQGGSGGRHGITKRSAPSDPFLPSQQQADERFADAPLRGPLPAAGFVRAQPPRHQNGPHRPVGLPQMVTSSS